MPQIKRMRSQANAEPRNLTSTPHERIRIVHDVVQEVNELGYKISLPAISLVTRYGTKALQLGTIQTSEEFAISATALFLAAAEQAKHDQRRHIQQRDIDRGWNTLRLCPGNLPPHLCMKRSIIDVQDELRHELPGFDMILNRLDEKDSWE